MSTITLSQAQLEQEQEGEIQLELVALRYVGSRSSFDATSHLEPAGWPRSTSLNGGAGSAPGPWYFAFTPDYGLATLENRDDLEVVYADQRERFAELLLGKRRLPDNAFGRAADQRLRDRVYDALGLDDPVEGGPIKQQLQELAGVEDDGDDDEESDQTLVETLADGYTRGQLGEAAKELRDDADDFNLKENAGKRDRAAFIAGFDDDERNAALPDDDEGGDD